MTVKKPAKILIIGPAWVGDMVMAQSLFKVLKSENPSVKIDVLAPAWSHGLLGRMPEVSSALLSPFKHGELDLSQRYQLGKTLRVGGYDQAIVLPNSFKSALILLWAKIPLRTGWRGEMRYGLLNDVRVLDKKRYPLMIERFMALGLAKNSELPLTPPWPRLYITEDSKKVALSRLQLDTTKPILALCPGAEFGISKRWPPGYYAQIASAKLAEGWQVWIFGSEKDRVVAEEIQLKTQHRCQDLTGKTNLGEAIDLLSLADVVVSNDSGLMHIAAAVQRPLIAIYGSSSPQFTPPLTDRVRILSLSLSCSPCFQRVCPLGHFKCMQDLQPYDVMQTMNELLEEYRHENSRY